MPEIPRVHAIPMSGGTHMVSVIHTQRMNSEKVITITIMASVRVMVGVHSDVSYVILKHDEPLLEARSCASAAFVVAEPIDAVGAG